MCNFTGYCKLLIRIRLYDLALYALKKGVPINDADRNGISLIFSLLNIFLTS